MDLPSTRYIFCGPLAYLLSCTYQDRAADVSMQSPVDVVVVVVVGMHGPDARRPAPGEAASVKREKNAPPAVWWH